MKQYDSALVIGRFQPVCWHHVDLLRQAKETSEQIIVGVGQPNYAIAADKLSAEDFDAYKQKYVIPFDRTKECLEAHLQNVPHSIFPVPDIFNAEGYAGHVLDRISEEEVDLGRATIVGENAATYACFENAGLDITVATDNFCVHATDVRRDLANTGTSQYLACTLYTNEIQNLTLAQKNLDQRGK
jgi:hypothetical protein